MKNLLIPVLILMAIAALIAGGVFLFSQSADAQLLASHGREAGEDGQVPPSGEATRGHGPFGGGELHHRGGHTASPLGALPELFGHLFILAMVIVVTLSLQKVARRLSKFRSA